LHCYNIIIIIIIIIVSGDYHVVTSAQFCISMRISATFLLV